MGGRMIGDALAKECVEVFLSTGFEGGRHQTRVDKLRS
jgi:ribose 5-phosphate isomerase B